jgi:hypothetical protein
MDNYYSMANIMDNNDVYNTDNDVDNNDYNYSNYNDTWVYLP